MVLNSGKCFSQITGVNSPPFGGKEDEGITPLSRGLVPNWAC